MNLLFAVLTQAITFLPLALGISISYHVLRATDMTLDGSLVLGAAVFAYGVSHGAAPALAALCAVGAGGLAGVLVSLIQRGGRVDPLLAGVLATFILTSVNLLVMGRPNINLLAQVTLVSAAFAHSDAAGWGLVTLYSGAVCALGCLVMRTRFGLLLRALGDNPQLLQRLGKPVERYRLFGFACTNMLSAAAGVLTAQTVGYADVSMGFGMTLTGIGAIILGQQLLRVVVKSSCVRMLGEFIACVLGVLLYFLAINSLLRIAVDPVYVKMILGLVLIVFLRGAVSPRRLGNGL